MPNLHDHPPKTYKSDDRNEQAIYSRVFDVTRYAWIEAEYPLIPCILSEHNREVGRGTQIADLSMVSAMLHVHMRNMQLDVPVANLSIRNHDQQLIKTLS